MKKKLWVILVLAVLVSIGLPASVGAKAKSTTKSVIVTTMDVKETYEVIGIVTSKTSLTDINALINAVKKAAMGIKADAVIGLRCVSYGDFFYAYGTAVKFKE